MHIPVVKMEHLKSLLGNDDKLVMQFIDLFKKEMPVQLNELSRSIYNNEWATVSTTAHAIKSQVRYLGLEELGNIAYSIELDAERTENLAGIPQLFSVLEQGINAVIERL